MAPNSTEEENEVKFCDSDLSSIVLKLKKLLQSDMDRFLFIIRDHLPKDYVDVLSMHIGNIDRVKDVVDYMAYISLVSTVLMRKIFHYYSLVSLNILGIRKCSGRVRSKNAGP